MTSSSYAKVLTTKPITSCISVIILNTILINENFPYSEHNSEPTANFRLKSCFSYFIKESYKSIYIYKGGTFWEHRARHLGLPRHLINLEIIKFRV